jgi:membrane-associated phospholipid phosphatase
MKIFNSFKIIIIENKYFFIPYFIFFILGGIEILLFPRENLLLWLNRNNSPSLDVFFYWVTNLGDGLFYIIIILILCLICFKYAFAGLLSFSSSGIAAQIIKNIIITPRPKTYLGEFYNLHYVEGVDVYALYSFPSGHSASAFSLFLLLSIITKYKPLGLIYFIIALLIGISRIYLLQHFFIDVWFGSFLGVIFTILMFIYTNYLAEKKSQKWMDASVFNRNINKTN